MSHPPDDSQDPIIEEAVQRFVDEKLQGRPPDVEEFVAQYPGLEQHIRQRLANLKEIAGLFQRLTRAEPCDFDGTEIGPSVGERLGTFEITGIIGRGGMGVVYKARDTRLEREVAVKALPVELSADATAQSRFRREARMLASLNHANIAAIYDIVESDDGRCYLILEYVPGRTLGEHIAGGRLKLEDALSIAQRIAEALSAAYEGGIIHRDLKPGNVKITPDGSVKVLDFGIAKALGKDDQTTDSLITQPGRIIGTPAYMSPEQMRGKAVDHRSDVWAFGCVLYEMLVGELAFEGATLSDTIAHVLQSEPDWEKLPPDVPTNIRVLLRRCLEKDPKHRLQHIGDAGLEIAETINAPAVAPPVTSVPSSQASAERRRLILAGILAGLVLGVLITASLFMTRYPSAPHGRVNVTTRTMITLPDGQSIASARSMPLHIAQPVLALSPDGSQLAYVASTGTTTQLFLRALDRFEAKPIPGTQGGFAPFFKPDGQAIGFFTEGKLKRVSLQGGEPVTICDATNPTGGCWAGDGMIYFGESHGGWLARVNAAAGGPSERVETENEAVDPTYRSTIHPESLPDERHLLLSSQAGILLLSLESHQRSLLIPGGQYGRFLPTDGSAGYIVYARAGAVEAVGFNWRTLETIGNAAAVLDGVMADSVRAVSQFAVSRTGTLAYVPGDNIARSTPTWVDRSGQELGALPLRTGFCGQFRLSPDGERLAIQVSEGSQDDIYVYDLTRDASIRLTRQGHSWGPIWSADGRHVTFTRGQDQRQTEDLVWVPADGGGLIDVLYTSRQVGVLRAHSWSPDGHRLAFMQTDRQRQQDIWVVEMSDPPEAHVVVSTEYNDWAPAFSPDGRMLAYTSDREGQYHVYVRSYPNADWERRVSDDFGEEPIWSQNAKELFYRNGDKWMVVTYSTEPKFSADPPRELFEGRYLNVPGTSYDVAPDGQRFIVLKPAYDDSGVAKIHLVQNWLVELEHFPRTE